MTDYTIVGNVINRQTGEGVADVRIEGWNRVPTARTAPEKQVTYSTTEDDGRFHLDFTSADFSDHPPAADSPDIYFKVWRDQTLLANTEGSLGWYAERPDDEVIIEIDLPPEDEEAEPPFVVRGQINYEAGSPAAGVDVRAFDRDLRREELLGQTRTDRAGRYEIRYGPKNFIRAERGHADVFIRVVSAENVLLGQSETIFNAAPEQQLDLVVRPQPARQRSEFEAKRALLAPILQDQVASEADLTDEDMAFLLRELAGEPLIYEANLRLLAGSVRLEQTTELPAAFFYGAGRILSFELPLGLDAYLSRPADQLGEAVIEAIGANVIPAQLEEALDDILARLEALRFEHGLLVRRRVLGRLLDEASGEPVVGYRVQAFDLADGETDLGFDLSDAQGLFALSFVTAADDDAPRHLRLHVADPEGEEIHQTDIEVLPDQVEVIDISTPVPELPDPAAIGWQTLEEAAGFTTPPELLTFLADNNIHTLLDIRNTGGLRRLQGLPLPEDDPAVQTLEAHANLTLISVDVAQNQMLINHEYRTITAIARQPRTVFVQALGDTLGDTLAMEIHARAAAQTRVLNNVLMGLQAEAANGFPSPMPDFFTNSPLPEYFPKKCSCEDCETAVSPLAYLADLLDYALRHLADNGIPLKHIAWLTEHLHQPFGELPASCEAMDRKVRQVRLCIEVLRSKLSTSAEYPNYLLEAYTTLLTKVGTSYEEIRLARTAADEARQALAKRLGITLSTADELGTLYHPPSELSEAILETLFGLADTIRDVLSEGAKLGDDQNQITRWHLDGAEWGWNTDSNGSVYARLTQAGGDYQVDLFRDKAMAASELVASGKRSSPTGPVELIEQNDRDLSGQVVIDYQSGGDPIEIVAIPRFTSWRLKHLHALWQEQDRPTDPYNTDSVEAQLPIVDPDVIGPDDFRTPAAGNDAFDLWLHRRKWVDARLEKFKSLKPDLDVMLNEEMRNSLTYPYHLISGATASYTPWLGNIAPDDFQTLFEALTQGPTPEDIEQARKDIETELNLTVESFTRLVELRTKDQLWLAHPDDNEQLTPEEWYDLYSILVQAQKRPFFADWIKEENQASPPLEFGPQHFWLSLREPEEGVWPPDPEATSPEQEVWPTAAMLAQDPQEQKPLIDPDKVKLKELPEPTIGAEVIYLWHARRRALDKILNDLKQAQIQGFLDVLIKAFGQKPPDPNAADWDSYLDNLADKLAGPNETEAAEKQIQAELYIDVEAFKKLLAVKANKQPTNEEWAELYPILVQAYKAKDLFDAWLAAEQGLWTPDGPIYNRIVKARQPRWRAAAEVRQRWRQALQRRSNAPILDPDLIDGEYLRNLLAANTNAIQMWEKRRNEIDGWYGKLFKVGKTLKDFDKMLTAELYANEFYKNVRATIEQRRESKSHGLDYVLKLVFGDPLPDFDGLLAALTNPNEKDEASQTITDELFLTVDDFQYILMDQIATPPADWTKLDDLLTQTFLLRSVLILDREQAQGQDIRDRLAQLSLTSAAFARLLSVRKLLARDEDWVLDEERQDIANILTQLKKRRVSATWQDNEQVEDILLAPEFFKLPEPPALTFPPPEPRQLTAWRATRRDRRDWEDTLQSRIDQVKTIVQAVQTAVSETEEETLPLLRGWLLNQLMLQVTDKAQWVTDNLLIDAKADGCQLTTRVSQAIETIQGLLWGVRTGQLTDTHPHLSLEAPDFEEEWQWLGSYATWRSAMFVFLYPENILMPHLRKYQTPTFKTLVEATGSGRRFNPELACQAAQEYSRYFKDVCTLRIEATCQTKTRLHQGNCRDRVAMGYSYPLYMFGRGNANPQTVYWSAYDPQAPNKDYAQTFWDVVPGMTNVEKIIGAVPYKIGEGNRHIFLFVMTNERKLVFSKYDLEKQVWEEEPSGDLELPQQLRHIFILHRPADPGIMDITKPPRLIFHTSAGIFVRALNLDASDWETLAKNSDNESEENNDDWVDYKDHEMSALAASSKEFILHSVAERKGWKIFFYSDEEKPVPYQKYSLLKSYSQQSVYDQGSFKEGKITEILRGPYLFSWIGIAPFEENYIHVYYKYGSKENGYKYAESRYGQTLVVTSNTDKPKLHGSMYELPLPLETALPTTGAFNSKLLVVRNKEVSLPATDYICKIEKKEDGSSLQLVKPLNPFAIAFDIVEIIKNKADRYLQNSTSYSLNKSGPKSNLTYLEEAYYFIPVHFALQLQKTGHYIEALNWFRNIYDHSGTTVKTDFYGKAELVRKYYVGLYLEESLDQTYQRSNAWLLDPLNPHSIAATRRNTYTRFTLLALIRCFLDYADAEFSQDTAESVPRARVLYQTALELLELPELNQKLNACDELIATIEIEVGDPQMKPRLGALKKDLHNINGIPEIENAVLAVTEILSRANASWETRINEAHVLITQIKAGQPTRSSLGQLVAARGELLGQAHTALITDPLVAATTIGAGDQATSALANTWEEPAINEYQLLWGLDDPLPAPTYYLVSGSSEGYLPVPVHQFCVPPNPVIEALRLRAELNLYKIRTCRNIAGMERQLDPYAAPTDTVSGLPQIGPGGQLVLLEAVTLQPTPYRYQVLIERAKRLVELAAQMESAMLAALEKRDTEYYNLLRARQDVRLTRAGVRLHELHVLEAQSGVELAEIQKNRVQVQVDTYQEWIDAGLNEHEMAMLDAFQAGAEAQIAAAFFQSGLEMASASGPLAPAVAILAQGKLVATTLAVTATAKAQKESFYASFERSKQQWELQKAVAEIDVKIGSQQIKIAEDHVRVVGQEQKIAEMQADHAQEIMEFLTKKFTNVDLYVWMSGILEGVYGYFLQQAASIAQLAVQQLAFERQEAPPPYIQADYWEAPTDGLGLGSDDAGADRRGLTGSARLLQDIYKLDQYAFDTDKRKLQLTKTISLARLMPVEFQQFRATGVLNFATTMELFDRDFPGHYLRLIRQVRTSVIALIPPTEGIRATLSTVGISRVVIGGNGLFQQAPIKRLPESVALTSPINATGLFELTPQTPQEMLLPFEGMGVDSRWELRMPKPSNPFDYSTIADVLLTIEYTALNDFTYRQQVIQQLDTGFSAERPFSFRHEFADPWYDLHNPELTATPMVVRFRTRRQDFPPNVEDLKIQHLVLYFARQDGATFEIPVTHLRFTEQGGVGAVGGGATSIDGIISTRRGNAGSWTVMLGKLPIGEWELALPNTPEMRKRFKDDEIEDILLVITYRGRTPEWPS
ncbi:MAG: hypothetical protein H6632_22290 [Anaerolineales bacterium]|nr:hypothetical protein [Anaerolineales bacterium]